MTRLRMGRLTGPQNSQADAEDQQVTLGSMCLGNLRIESASLKSHGGIPRRSRRGGGQLVVLFLARARPLVWLSVASDAG